ncbi:hypothetical protein OESDEN_04080 [Oesophagostomum dentatum]|uniref:Uncharacterized protein n=1 Tax=Oesophagostomum dentatum TaxID=61180 RepID=A0A0B1TIM9_OESDE|nr:hypothetical protein OESDEN_04080 [Oesophagostomum dentatum]
MGALLLDHISIRAIDTMRDLRDNVRHVGDLGNIEADRDDVARFRITSRRAKERVLRGKSLCGRNAGNRLAYGVIGHAARV